MTQILVEQVIYTAEEHALEEELALPHVRVRGLNDEDFAEAVGLARPQARTPAGLPLKLGRSAAGDYLGSLISSFH